MTNRISERKTTFQHILDDSKIY